MEITEEIRDIISELMNTGVGRAAKSLYELLDHEIQLSIPNIKILKYNEIDNFFHQQKINNYVNVTQNFDGEITGTGIVSFPVVNGKTLINMLIDHIDYDYDDDKSKLDIIELEAMSEVANIIINAVQGTISDMIELEAKCSLPQTTISKNIITDNNLKKDSVYLIGETVFSVKDCDIKGIILLIYTYQNIELLVKKFLDLY